MVGTRIVAIEGRNAARGIAGGRLDLQHVRAQVGEDLPAQQPALVGEIEHPVRAQHAGGGFSFRTHFGSASLHAMAGYSVGRCLEHVKVAAHAIDDGYYVDHGVSPEFKS